MTQKTLQPDAILEKQGVLQFTSDYPHVFIAEMKYTPADSEFVVSTVGLRSAQYKMAEYFYDPQVLKEENCIFFGILHDLCFEMGRQ